MDQTKSSATPHASTAKTVVNPPKPTPTATPAPSRVKRFLGAVVAVMVILGTCYLGGYLHGRADVARVAAELDASRKAAQSSQSQLTDRLDSERRRVSLLEARRNLDLAITALDARNFGIAEREVKHAAEHLSTLRTVSELVSLTGTLQAFHLVATEDLGPQRKQIADWVTFLDQQLPAQQQ